MNAYFATRICAYIVFTGGVLALGFAFGQLGLLIAGAILLLFALMRFQECAEYPKKEVPQVEIRDRSKESPESW